MTVDAVPRRTHAASRAPSARQALARAFSHCLSCSGLARGGGSRCRVLSVVADLARARRRRSMRRQSRSRSPACCSTCRPRRSAQQVQRHPGPQERIDLVFRVAVADAAAAGRQADRQAAQSGKRRSEPRRATAGKRLVRHHRGAWARCCRRSSGCAPSIRVISRPKPPPGADGLAILPFRAGTPYEGEDLVYFGSQSGAVFRPLHAAGPCGARHLHSTNARSMAPRSRCGFRATGSAIGAMSAPASTA